MVPFRRPRQLAGCLQRSPGLSARWHCHGDAVDTTRVRAADAAPSTGALRTDLRGRPGSRHLLHDQVREALLLGSCRSTGGRGRRAGPRAREPERGEDPLNDGRGIDRGHPLPSPGAARTTPDVQVDSPRRPRPVAGPVCAPASCPGSHLCRAQIGHPVTLRAAIGDALRPPACVRCQHAVIEPQVDLGPRRQGRQLLQERHRLEEQVRRPIAPGSWAQVLQSDIGPWKLAARGGGAKQEMYDCKT